VCRLYHCREVVDLTINFYRHWYQGSVPPAQYFSSPDYTMERLVRIRKLRTEHHFNGYILQESHS